MLSAIVFTFWPDEEIYLSGCLDSLNFVDEIIIVDNGASEKTLEIAKKYTKNIFFTKSRSFAERHNLGRKYAKGDWLLFIDGDERVSKSLAKEILEELKTPKNDSYELRRVNFYLGKEVRYGDRFPDFVTRLFKSSSLVEWSGSIHESSTVTGTRGKLSSPFYHLTHRDIFSMVEKTINYSELEATLRLNANHPPVVWWRLPRVFLTEFFHRLVIQQGWRQGIEGWIDGIFQAFSMFIVYVRLWELQRKEKLSETYQKIDERIKKGEI